MLIGIDVGGTFTDGVLCSEGRIINSAKHPTKEDDLQNSIFAVLDDLLQGIKGSDKTSNITQVVLSTTLVTNLLASGGGDEVALVLLPGPGRNFRNMEFLPHTYFAAGATNFRGRNTEPLDQKEIEKIG